MNDQTAETARPTRHCRGGRRSRLRRDGAGSCGDPGGGRGRDLIPATAGVIIQRGSARSARRTYLLTDCSKGRSMTSSAPPRLRNPTTARRRDLTPWPPAPRSRFGVVNAECALLRDESANLVGEREQADANQQNHRDWKQRSALDGNHVVVHATRHLRWTIFPIELLEFDPSLII